MDQAAGRVQELFNKYLDNQLTAAEYETLWRSLETGREMLLAEQLDRLWEQAAAQVQSLPAADWDAKMRVLRQAAPVKPIRSRWRVRAVAAAAVIGMAATGVWLFTHTGKPAARDQHSTAATQLPAGIRPGGNKAVLTLADGSTVTLDSTVNGTVARQGDIRVQQQNGQLAYNGQGRQGETVLYNVLSTPRGGQYRLTLPDGTKVWLNAASSIRYPTTFSGKEREVTLTGEGYFEVASNAAQPFKVTTASQQVEVLGTQFNINAYPDELSIKTTLLEGSVRVINPTLKNQTSAILTPGQQSILTPQGIRVKEVNTEDETAWKNELFAFNDTDFESMMRQLSRWYDVDIEFRGKLPGRQLIGNVSRQYSIAQVLKMLAFTAGIQYEVEGKKIILSIK